MVQPRSTKQEPTPGLEREADQQSPPVAQFSQATAEGGRAAAIRGRRPLGADLVNYITTSW